MLTYDHLRHALDYNADTGQFVWRNPSSDKMKPGQSAGTIERYLQIRLGGKRYLAHRLAWLYMTGAWPDRQIDHINGDKLDNRWANLRLATPTQNNANAVARKRNSSGFKGVTWHSRNRKWQAQIAANGRHFYLGQFETAEAAAEAYQQAAARLHGEFARL
jgi:hypothetical protein